MLPSRAKQSLARNLRKISGGTDTQGFRERLSKKTGGAVSPRTIGTMMSEDSGNPTLANIEAVAVALGMTISELLSDGNLAQESRASYAASPAAASSPEASRLIERIHALESSGASSPQLYHTIEAVIDLVSPSTSPGDYAALRDAINSRD